MFGFIKRKQKKDKVADKVSTETLPVSDPTTAESNPTDLSKSLEKTKRSFSDGMADFFLGKKSIDDELLDELETRLLSADVGIDATTTIIDELQSDISRKAINDAEGLHIKLAQIMKSILQPCEQSLSSVIANTESDKPFVILVVGINGAKIRHAGCR
jgi:fused signal recognition particle receptor